jgi:hypothetical protein
MNNTFEVGEQYWVTTTGKTLDPLVKVPQKVLDKVQRHTDRFFHVASKDLVVSFNVIANVTVKAPGGVAERAEQRVVSMLIADETVHGRIGVCPKLLGAVAATAVERTLSHPSQASHMRTLVSEANKFHDGQTSTTANRAFKKIAGHVVTNMMNNPLMQTF